MRLIATVIIASLVAACGGGGGGGGAPVAPPVPPPPPPPPPPPAAGPTDPGVALARPISSVVLCGNGMSRRAEAQSADRFVVAEATVGINHAHAVATGVWTASDGSLESVIRTGAVVAASLDRDCWPDIVFTTGATANGQLIIYHNLDGRGFEARLQNVTPAGNPLAGLGVADLNGDYHNDLVLGNLLAGDIEVFGSDGAGGFDRLQSLPASRSTYGFAFGDYSGDEWLDVYAAHWDISPAGSPANALFRNRGDDAAGSLLAADALAGTNATTVPHDFNLAPGFADLDGDRAPDLLIGSDFGSSQVLLNTGTSAFTVVIDSPALADENAAGQAIRDFDNDGSWDWFLTSVHAPGDGRDWPWGLTGNKLYWGDSESPYLTAADPGAGIANAGWPWGVCAADFNNDGWTDLFVENGFGFLPQAVRDAAAGDPFIDQIDESLDDQQFLRPRLYLNQGDRTFIDVSAAWELSRPSNGRGVACFDHDRDGDVDIAVAQNSGSAQFYENRHSGADGNHFVSLRLVGIAPNTLAVGTTVTVTAGGATQRQQVSANSTFQGQSVTELHFGLGTAATIDVIEITWPDGAVEALTDVPANRFLTLVDPRMLPYPEADRLARIDAAIATTLDYVANPAPLDDDLLLGLTWMERMHGLSLGYSPGDELIQRAAAASGATAQRLRGWRRLFDADYLDQGDFGNLAGFDAVTFAGVYCHEIPLQDADIQALRDFALGGDYFTTHALLALLWALDNDCPMPPSYDASLLDSVIRDVYEIAARTGDLTDLRIEAMAFLAAAGRHDLIRASWVDAVLDAQLGTGEWRPDPAELETLDHTTGLALWLLLLLAEDTRVLSGFVAQSWGP